MNKIAISFLAVLCTLSACKQSPSNKEGDSTGSFVINDTAKERITATLKEFVDSGKIAGVSALIFEKNKEVYYNAFGKADREEDVAMDRNTMVRIYSMTKPITGVALMTLYEQGAFELDDSLAQYAPEFTDMNVFIGLDENGKPILEPAKRPITIRDVTRHTAGFASNANVPGLEKLLKEANPMALENTLSEMAEKLAGLPLVFHPGEQWAYGPSVDVQAYLVERLSGKPFDQYMKEKILDPLGMTHTHYVIPEADRSKLAALYFRNSDGQLNRIPDEEANAFNTQDWPLKPGGWGLVSTLDDYMRFAQMLANKGALDGTTILKPETVELMATNHLEESVTERMWLPSKGQVGFGIDFAVRLRPPASNEENNGVVGEFFWDGAASTVFWVDPVNELTAVLFVQLMPFDQVKLHKKFRDAIYGQYQGEEN